MAMVLRSQSEASIYPCVISYDVFLSFRGEDTRKNFTDHLYSALKQAEIRTFRDDDEMERGKLLDPELKKAIRQSAISIIVFSRNYASSKWCLEEVLTIIEEQERLSSKHEVVPVFYNVEPSDVRNQTGSFEEAFGRYDDLIEAETDNQKKEEWLQKVKAWRVSLRKAANLTGMVLANGHEAKFVSEIVNVIRKKLDYKALYVEDKLVGIKANVDEIDLWLQDPSPNANILVIQGIGGIGKTTISKCIFNSNLHQYDGSCFLADINETSNQPNGLLRLQSQLLSTILRSQKEEVIWNVHEGIIKVRDAICNKKVLVILDDVTTTEQLNALLGPQRFHPGSKVIITTRHKWLLNAFKVHPTVHTISELDPFDSFELFSLYAFEQSHPIEEAYIVQSKFLVDHCGGLPLALRVLGSSLRGKSIDIWEDAMRKLKSVPNSNIQKVLQLSYESLEDDKDKDLFLHVACFFVGEDKDLVVTLLAECDLYPVVGIKNLIDRSLLYVEKKMLLGCSVENERLMMHRLIMEMGREVIRQESPKEPGKRSRLWRHKDSLKVLKESEGTRKVEGLVLDMQMVKEANSISAIKMDNARKRSYEELIGTTTNANEANFKIGALEKMKNLMLLQLNYVTFSGNYKKLPKKLRLLRWHGFPLKVIPSDIALDKLVVLDMRYSKLKHVWNKFKLIASLKILNLSYSEELIKTPDFHGLPSLESLILEGCLTLNEICESIAYLEGLVLLDLTDCRSLRDIPCLPRSLVSLKMSGCLNLRVLGRWDSSLLPSFLVDVDISECNLFDNSFPKDWSNLFSLKFLNIDGNNITSLPNCIQRLPNLEVLSAGNCSQLQTVLGVPKSVQDLQTSDNMSLEKVQTMANPLTFLSLYNCQKLCVIEGCFKFETTDKFDMKIIRYLGLESVFEEGKELGLDDKEMVYTEHGPVKVSYEFGIFSTYVSGKTLPSCFRYKERGSRISFRVPSHRNSSRISGLNVSFRSTSYFGKFSSIWKVEVNNKTKALVWRYTPTIHVKYKNTSGIDYVWLSLWKCGNLLDDGDEIAVSIELCDSEIVEECCINLVYEDDVVLEDNKETDAERKEHDRVSIFDQISWTDRLLVEISDYVHRCKTYWFKISGAYDVPNIDGFSDFIVDWWGLRPYRRCRNISESISCVI